MTLNRFVLLIGSAVLLAGCGPAAKQETKKAEEPAPPVYQVKFETTKGDFVVEVHRDWAPLGADRFYELTKAKFFDGSRFFRVLKGFVVQFGLNGDPDVNAKWHNLNFVDDPVKESNTRGTITLRDQRAGHPDDPGLHQPCRQQQNARRPGLRTLW